MNIRSFAIAILATAALAGCATGYSYRAGPGDYYYGQPSVDYYGYGAPYGSIGYGYGGGWGGYLGYGYGYGYGYPYGYYYHGYYPYYAYYRHRHHRHRDRDRDHDGRGDRVDDRSPTGSQLPDNGVRYQSRARHLLQGTPTPAMVPESQVQYRTLGAPVDSLRYPSRFQGPGSQVQPTLDGRGGLERGVPLAVPQSVERIQRGEPRFESRAPRFEPAPAPARSSLRLRDSGRARRP